ncbi:MAG TPA: thermonuclease family protein [Sphingomicrobium sp.]|nr:thermonuclease family protein [Sphingomicrobium sp.]
MSKHWNPARQRAAVRPSRIRREPVRLSESAAEIDPRKARALEARARKLEVRYGIIGVLAIAAVLAAVVIGISAATFSKYDPAAAAAAARWGQCYNGDRTHCVLDGDSIYFEGSKVQIAGIAAPRIQGGACDAERSRGIDAATRLAALLNSGTVSVGAPFQDAYGRAVSKVQVGGQDVGQAMIAAEVARQYEGDKYDWCGVEG